MKKIYKIINLMVLVATFTAFSHQGTGMAAEGAASHYLPGLAGDIALAVAPDPGLQVANSFWFQTGDVSRAVLQGQVDLSLDLDLFLVIPSAFYTFEKPILGGLYTIGIAIPFGYADLSARVTGPLGNSLEVDGDSFNVSDVAITPLQLNWQLENFHFKFAETIIAPTGGYDTTNLINLGRNYWSFDSVGALTWFNTETGTEISAAPGIMFNTENNDTNYKTGTEFHLDFTINQFIAETFAVGLRGYYYKQITGDSGSGAVLGDFKSEAVGVGPGFIWTPKFANGDLTLLGKWLHDFHTENRFDSDYVTFSAAWKF